MGTPQSFASLEGCSLFKKWDLFLKARFYSRNEFFFIRTDPTGMGCINENSRVASSKVSPVTLNK